MLTRTKLGLSIMSLTTLAVGGAVLPSARADIQAQPNDAVIVGSDTVQFASGFLADGDPDGDAGYNTGKFNRVFDFFATGDSNGRFTVAGGVSGAPGTAGETSILRAGTQPVLRPNGSGKGLGALVADSTPTGYDGLPTGSITLARTSRLPTKTVATGTSEDATCDNTAGCGGYHVYEVANDTLGLAALSSGSNAVALDANQLWNIYNCTSGYQRWNDTSIGGTSSDPIVPVIPQSGSGSRTFFLATIDAASGHTSDPSLSSTCVKTAQEHDPNGITSETGSYASVDGGTTAPLNYVPADAIEPFSGARIALLNAGYFGNSSGTAGTPAAGYTAKTIAFVTGNSKVDTSMPSFSTVRAVYVIARVADLAKTCSAKTTPACFVPGGTQTAVQSLISSTTTTPAFASAAFAADIQDAGFTAKFQDCGVDPDDSASSTNKCVTNP